MKTYETLDSGIKIVEFEPSLAPGLADFWNICSQNEDDEWGGESGISTASEVISQHEIASHYNVYIALDGDDVVGYCSFGRYYYDANTAYIPLLGVRPDYRGKKVGKALVLRCVQRTMELGYPRLDLFTWSGNTAAVPLYKKCGFLWEDRPDGTHLANFMPTILTTPLFADFFSKADWYADSTRSLEITPDGKKVNGFELFGYSWEKDGEALAIGYERSGRQMRMIETNDYKIELMTPDHELAFGRDYECTFVIENKTGKELNIKINGREDKNIKLDCNQDLQITGNQEINSKFFVGPVSEPQDLWKVHPCLLADVEINGQAVTFGLGINAKFPLLIKFNRECTIDQVGMDVRTHIDIQSSLPEDATVTVNIPKCTLLTIKDVKKSSAKDAPATGTAMPMTVSVPAKGRASIPATSTTMAIGYEKLTIDCTAVFKSGAELSFAAPVFLFTKDMTHAYSGEDIKGHHIINGPWELWIDKEENNGHIAHLTNKGYDSDWHAYQPPKLGKPYDDEFNLIKPIIKTYQQDGAMVMEAEYVSEKFPGLVVTQVYSLFATGFITRTSRVENRSDKPYNSMLQDNYGLGIGFNSVYSYKGQITQNYQRYNPGGMLEGFQNISSEDLDENWVYEDNPAAPRGYCWPKDYTPIPKWDTLMSFEIDLGQLAPGQVFVTKPVTYALGLFTKYNDLRNYALQAYNQTSAPATQAMEVVLNGYNPFVTGIEAHVSQAKNSAGDVNHNIKLDVINNRDEVQEGTITVASEALESPMSQTNPHEDVVECNSFDLSLNADGDIAVVSTAINMVNYEKTVPKALFFPKGHVTTSMEGTAYRVSNGAITFKADPAYGHCCYSLTDANGQEWLLNQYPEHKPYSWFNPFIGGIRLRIEDMDDRAFLKEKITADFAEVRDSLGNLWTGICMALSVSENEKLKGAVYKTYYLTQPGLPVMSVYYTFENNTGEYKNDRTWISTCLKPDDDAKNVFVEVTDKQGSKHRRRMGSLETPEIFFEGPMVVSSSRPQRMYAQSCYTDTDYSGDFWGCNQIPVMAAFAHTGAEAAHGEMFTSCPVFFVITDKCLPAGVLADLDRVGF